jgi:hypothetical protein
MVYEANAATLSKTHVKSMSRKGNVPPGRMFRTCVSGFTVLLGTACRAPTGMTWGAYPISRHPSPNSLVFSARAACCTSSHRLA